MSKVYFDYAATTPVDSVVLDLFQKVNERYYMNNVNDEEGMELEKECEAKILSLLNLTDEYEVVFTSSATEANNLAVIGRYANSVPKHLITSKVEHPSMLESFKALEEMGHNVTYLSINKSGKVDEEELLASITSKTSCVSIMSVNNEIGSVNDINSIFTKVKEINPNIITITDAVQALGKISLDMSNVDMITFSAHKVYGLKGIGVLVKKKNIILQQQVYGSKSLIRPGTYPLSSKIIFVNVFKKAIEECNFRSEDVLKKQKYFLEKMDLENIAINTVDNIGIVSLTLNVDALAETFAKVLYDNGVVVSTKSACSQKLNKPSHVLLALGLEKEKIDKTIRISFSHKTTYEEIDVLIKELKSVINTFKYK